MMVVLTSADILNIAIIAGLVIIVVCAWVYEMLNAKRDGGKHD